MCGSCLSSASALNYIPVCSVCNVSRASCAVGEQEEGDEAGIKDAQWVAGKKDQGGGSEKGNKCKTANIRRPGAVKLKGSYVQVLHETCFCRLEHLQGPRKSWIKTISMT